MGRIKDFFNSIRELDDIDEDEPEKPEEKAASMPQNSLNEKDRKSIPEQPVSAEIQGHCILTVFDLYEYRECVLLADKLKNKEAVLVNFRDAKEKEGRYVFNFLSGVVFALDGNVQKVGYNIYIFTPKNVTAEIPVSKSKFDIPLSHDWTMPLKEKEK